MTNPSDKPEPKEPRDRYEGFDLNGYSFRIASTADKARCMSFSRFMNRFKAMNEHNSLGPLAGAVEDALAAFIVGASKTPGSEAVDQEEAVQPKRPGATAIDPVRP